MREYWLVDPSGARVTVVDFAGPSPVRRLATGADSIRSTVLPDLALPADQLFA